MGRTKVKKRITPRPRRPVIKTIIQAREYILTIVPPGLRTHIWASWHDERGSGLRFSVEKYSCTVRSTITFRELADVEADSPSELVTKLLDFMRGPIQHEEPRPRGPKPVAETVYATIDLSRSMTVAPARPANEPRSSVPRLGSQLPLLTYGGE